MTAKKDLKRRIRERMERTGESYVVARRAVLAERVRPEPAGFPSPSLHEASSIVPELLPTKPFEVIEMDDFTEQAAELGMKCTLSITTALAEQIDPRVVLARFREILDATTKDPAMDAMRAVVLRGEVLERRPRGLGWWWDGMQRFVNRVRAGIGGISDGGTMLAVPMQGNAGLVMMVVHLGYGIVQPSRHPRVVLTTAEAAGFHVESLAMRTLR